eukprot:6325062-Pyramimonas_sp.AAC.1
MRSTADRMPSVLSPVDARATLLPKGAARNCRTRHHHRRQEPWERWDRPRPGYEARPRGREEGVIA